MRFLQSRHVAPGAFRDLINPGPQPRVLASQRFGLPGRRRASKLVGHRGRVRGGCN